VIHNVTDENLKHLKTFDHLPLHEIPPKCMYQSACMFSISHGF